jgi:hypothetical protein
MIVVFKTGRSPSMGRTARGREAPPDYPPTAVETCCRYLIWWITIIKYNLKARPVSGREASSLEHDPEKWEPVFRKDHAQTKR